jgi:hypothetical protein
MVALLERDAAAGLYWNGRALQHFVSFAGADITDLVEARANHHVIGGDIRQAARLYAAASTNAQRLGSSWPRHPGSAERLAAVRAQLEGEFEVLWGEGTALTLDDLLRLGATDPA